MGLLGLLKGIIVMTRIVLRRRGDMLACCIGMQLCCIHVRLLCHCNYLFWSQAPEPIRCHHTLRVIRLNAHDLRGITPLVYGHVLEAAHLCPYREDDDAQR